MNRTRRSRKGQSMVEYAIGIGAVAALCMVALGSLGHICGDMISMVCHSIIAPGQHSPMPGRTINPSATPWVLE
ncbi:MAG: hypothetical protein H6677_13620 [Candidatus Obscuribacterales bacterium]|nr:hypothetical protein [Candidatus Obscuribacterales bacterium]